MYLHGHLSRPKKILPCLKFHFRRKQVLQAHALIGGGFRVGQQDLFEKLDGARRDAFFLTSPVNGLAFGAHGVPVIKLTQFQH